MNSHLKILLLGDYSHCHSTLAEGLRVLGHDVTVGSDGTNWMQTPRDFDTSRKSGKLGGAWLYFRTLYPLHNFLKGFDIVAINDPNFLTLHPVRLRKLFDRLKKENGSVFYTAMSTDILYLDMLMRPDNPLTYNEWFVDGLPSRWHLENAEEWENWKERSLVDYQKHVFDNIDGAVAVLYEYYEGLKYGLPADKIAYAGIPINTDVHKVTHHKRHDKVKILLGRDRNRTKFKGTDYLEIAARNATERFHENAIFKIVENIPYVEFIKELADADIVLDQIYSYSPSTTPLIAMAMGKTVLSGGEDQYYDFIDEHDNRPIINAAPTIPALEQQITDLICNPQIIEDNIVNSRKFIEKHNNYVLVAQRFLDFWLKKLNK